MSIRRACRVLRTDPSTYHYKGKRASQAGLTRRIKEIAETRVRYGYRRIHVLLQREGWTVNAKRIYRLYKGLGLQLRNKTPKRRVKAKLRDDRRPAVQANETWAEPLKVPRAQHVEGRRRGWTSYTTSSRRVGKSGC